MAALLLALLFAAAPALAGAQVIRGHVLDGGTGAGIEGASLTAFKPATEAVRSVVTDSTGWFLVTLPDSGSFRLTAQRLGYATTRSRPLFVYPADTVTVEFRIRPEAVALEPLVVTGRSARGWSRFSERMNEWGKGVFMTPAMIDSINPRHPADVFRGQEKTWLRWRWGRRKPVPGIRTFLGSGCVSYLLDGRLVDPDFWGGVWEGSPLEYVTGEDVVAVEYYRYIGEVPPELRRYAGGDHQCGLVVFWTAVGW